MLPSLFENPVRAPAIADSMMASIDRASADGAVTNVGVKSSARGWLLSLGAERLVAVGERELVHILAQVPKLQRIPRAPAHASYAMVWQERILPVIDLGVLLDTGGAPSATSASVIGIVAFRGARKGAIVLGALALHEVPRRIESSESDARDMPSRLHALEPWALSCVDHLEHGAVPILHLSKLFAAVSDPAAGAA